MPARLAVADERSIESEETVKGCSDFTMALFYDSLLGRAGVNGYEIGRNRKRHDDDINNEIFGTRTKPKPIPLTHRTGNELISVFSIRHCFAVVVR